MSDRVSITVEITEHELARIERLRKPHRAPRGDPPMQTTEEVARLILRQGLSAYETEHGLPHLPEEEPPFTFADSDDVPIPLDG